MALECPAASPGTAVVAAAAVPRTIAPGDWAVERIAQQASLARVRVARWLARRGRNRRRVRLVRRYEHDRPGALLHVDIKKPARFDRRRHRVTGKQRRAS